MKKSTYKCDCCKKTFSYTLPYIIKSKPNFSSNLGKRTLCFDCAKFIFSTIDMSDENVPSVSKPNKEKQTLENNNDSYDRNEINSDVPLGWDYSDYGKPSFVTDSEYDWWHV